MVVAIEQTSFAAHVDVVVHDEWMRVERYGVELAVELRTLPDSREEIVLGDAILRQKREIDRLQEIGGGIGAKARQVNDGGVWRTAPDRRHRQFCVVGRSPREGDGLDVATGVLLLKCLLHVDHARTVAAAEEVPEGNRTTTTGCAARCKRATGQSREP